MPSGTAKNLATFESANSAHAFDLISPRQLAAELGMCLRTLQRLHNARSGPPRITLNRHVFYRRATVSEWLARCEGYGGAQSVRKPRIARTRNARRVRRAA